MAKINLRTLLPVLVKLGLDDETGTSEYILADDISDLWGKKINGNGMVIRRDTHPFDKLNYSTLKEKSKVVAIKFNGFKSVNDVVDSIEDQNEKSLKRIAETHKIIEEREQDKKTLLRRYNNHTQPIYNWADLEA